MTPYVATIVRELNPPATEAMAEYLRQNFLKIHFAKVAPIELSSGIHYEKAASIKPVRCPVQIFLAKKGYQMTSLQ